MAKGIYFGDQNNIARKVKKLYFGDEANKARKVKKVYFGDTNGIARICYSAGISKVNKTMNISEAVGGRFTGASGACATVGDKIIVSMTKATGKMDTFNTSLVKGSAPLPLIAVTNLSSWCATQNPSYAIFAGGKHLTDRDGNPYLYGMSSVDCYNSSLAVTSAVSLEIGRYNIGTGNIGDYATFAGGVYDNGITYYGYIEAYNSSLAKATSVKMDTRLSNPIGLNVPGYLLYSHGYNYYINGVGNHIYALNSTLVRSFRSITRSINNTSSSAGASNKSYAVYMQGYNQPLDVVNASLVVSELAIGTDGRFNACGISSDELAIFAGGSIVGGLNKSDVITFNQNLVRSIIDDKLSIARRELFSGKLGNYGFVIGGYNPYSDVVDIFEQ